MVSVVLYHSDQLILKKLEAQVQDAATCYLLDTCSSPDRLLELLELELPNVLVMAAAQAGESNIQLIRYIKTSYTGVKILLLTPGSDAKMMTLAIAAGISSYIPWSESVDIVAEIQRVHADKLPLSPQLARQLIAKLTTVKSEFRSILTAKEEQVLQLIAKGCSYVEISEQMKISIHTVRSHLRKIYVKLGVHSKNEAVYEAGQSGWLLTQLSAKHILEQLLTNQQQSAPMTLSGKEQKILLLLAKGLSYGEAARASNNSINTIRSHIRAIYRKLEVHSMSEVVFEASQLGYVERLL